MCCEMTILGVGLALSGPEGSSVNLESQPGTWKAVLLFMSCKELLYHGRETVRGPGVCG